MNKRIIALLAGVMAIALIAAGCGSSDDDETTTVTITKAEFVKQGNAICAAGNKEIGAEIEAYVKENGIKAEPTDEQAEEIANSILIPSISGQVDEIRALGIPSEDEEQVNEFLDAADEAVEEAEENPSALVAEDSTVFADVNELATEYGLTVCGEEG